VARSEQVSVVRGKPHATFDAAGAGNVMMAAGLRAIAKAMGNPPEPKIGAPVPDPTVQRPIGSGRAAAVSRNGGKGRDTEAPPEN
jgi:hypothetical protein